jgi:hypothetical protein
LSSWRDKGEIGLEIDAFEVNEEENVNLNNFDHAIAAVAA